ncbi:MAG: dihydrofolate reductase family protein [Chloroflexota bacterium]|nr:dihydrofolate reductase family protein [Chloroflexota bacterium]
MPEPTGIHGRPLLPAADARGARPYLAINMVATLDGRAAVGGTATGIGTPLDRRLMRELRAEADVVLHGAGTVRADPLSARVPPELVQERLARGQPPQPTGAIVTASGDLPREHPYYETRTLIYVLSEQGVDIPVGSIEVVRAPRIEDVVLDLGQRGASRIVCEGGPRLNAALLQAGLVDELFLTLAPKLAGGHEPLTIVHGGAFGEPIQLQLRSVERHGDELFMRYAIGRPS